MKVNYKTIRQSLENGPKTKPQEKGNKFLDFDEKLEDMDFSKIVENNKNMKDLYNMAEIPELEYF